VRRLVHAALGVKLKKPSRRAALTQRPRSSDRIIAPVVDFGPVSIGGTI